MINFKMNYNHQIFDQTPKIILSPHYDDFIFSLGGLAWHWSNHSKPPTTNLVLFSQSGYANDQNQFLSASVAAVSQLRLKEEQRALGELHNVKLILGHQLDAPLRGYRDVTRPRHFKLLSERALHRKLTDLIISVFRLNGQIFIPLAIGSHIDHLLVRDVAMKLIKSAEFNQKKSFYFYEDLPYAGSRELADKKNATEFIKNNHLRPIEFEISLIEKLRLINFYPSQLNEKTIKEIKFHASSISLKGDFERVWWLP